MKRSNLFSYVALTLILLFMVTETFAVKTKKKNLPDSDDAAFVQQEKFNQQQKQKLEQAALAKRKNEETLLAEHPLLQTFLLISKKEINDEILPSYTEWLKNIRSSIFDKYDALIDSLDKMCRFFLSGDLFLDAQYKRYCDAINKSHEQGTNPEVYALTLRYDHLTGGSSMIHLSATDIEFLTDCQWSKNDALASCARILLESYKFTDYGKQMFKNAVFLGNTSVNLTNTFHKNPLLKDKYPYCFKYCKEALHLLTTHLKKVATLQKKDSVSFIISCQRTVLDVIPVYRKAVADDAQKIKEEITQLEGKLYIQKTPTSSQPKKTVQNPTAPDQPLITPTLINEIQPDTLHSTPGVDNIIQHNSTLPETVAKTKSESSSDYFFKVFPCKDKPFSSMAERVSLWLDDSEAAYNDCKGKYGITNDFSKPAIILYHTLPWHIIDDYINPLAIPCSWESQNSRKGDKSYNIPCEISVNDTSTKGVISYGVAHDGVLFHRCFSERAYEKVKNDVTQRNYNADFPLFMDEDISKDQQKLRCKKTITSDDDTKYVISQNSFYVQIRHTDKDNNIIVTKLIKTGIK